MTRLQHGRVSIELHRLKPAKGQPLLLLHALGESAETWPASALVWSHGPIYALDFAGHGKSGHLRGGAYYPEYFLADADLALAQMAEPCVLVGAGIGAYVALMLAGSRADRVSAALLLEGAGLEGGGSSPDHGSEAQDIEGFETFIETASIDYAASTDPLVALCERDLRPVDYVTSFAEAARPMLFSPRVGREISAPDWWRTAFEANRAVAAPAGVAECLDKLASMATESTRVADRLSVG
jgi:pimeloyl-ACP methyl ester carboxylesterase